jgi:hypothetical protein
MAAQAQIVDYYRVGQGFMSLGILCTGGLDSHVDVAAYYLAGPVAACMAGDKTTDYTPDVTLATIHMAKELPGCEWAAKPLVEALAAKLRVSFRKQWPVVERMARYNSGWA